MKIARKTRALAFPILVLLTAWTQGAALAQPTVDSEIAPSGKLRVAMIGANPVLVTKRPDGSIGGISADLGSLIAKRVGAVLVPIVYDSPAAYTRSLTKSEWDIAIGPRNSSRDVGLEVSPDFMLVENLFVAAPGHDFGDAGQVDRPGVRVAVALDGAPDKYLSRTLKSAQIVRVFGSVDAAIETLHEGKADVYGSNGSFVYEIAAGLPGTRIIPGAFTTVPMAVALAKGRSTVAQQRISEIVIEAKRTGLVEQAIQRNGLKGVRIAQD